MGSRYRKTDTESLPLEDDVPLIIESDDSEPLIVSGSSRARRRHNIMSEKSTLRRNLVGFWFLGLCNNFAYVIMLSAAHDILDDETAAAQNSTSGHNSTTTVSPVTTTINGTSYMTCNQISTGAILLADILPTLLIKFTAPFFLQRIGYRIKVSLTILFAMASFLIVAFANEVWLSIIGVVCASISGGLGEITFLSLTSFFDRNVISTWSSGTGGAGVFGSLSYAGFTSAGVSPRTTVLLMVVVPVIMAVNYFCVLIHPKGLDNPTDDTASLIKDKDKKTANLSLKDKLRLVVPLLKFMIPLTTVYFGEYFINQGLHELLYYNNTGWPYLNKKEQYRWYQVDYQIGVFLSRSSVNIFPIKKVWILPFLQLINMGVLLAQVFYRFIPNIWIIFAIVFYEGFLGGAAYVNTFYRIAVEVPPEHLEFSMGVATIGDTVGIAVAGAAAIPSHNHMCSLQIKMK
ncbi:battenin isoform X2 [Patella vulgata]|uniref:battenin isoform X2 n=1 Tax=Patella vulgata TaxID=6465 RepID=UPI0024A85D1B|nr:battenin isoform X2 [Patella vulgata]